MDIIRCMLYLLVDCGWSSAASYNYNNNDGHVVVTFRAFTTTDCWGHRSKKESFWNRWCLFFKNSLALHHPKFQIFRTCERARDSLEFSTRGMVSKSTLVAED
jgi:hypothetical protein